MTTRIGVFDSYSPYVKNRTIASLVDDVDRAITSALQNHGITAQRNGDDQIFFIDDGAANIEEIVTNATDGLPDKTVIEVAIMTTDGHEFHLFAQGKTLKYVYPTISNPMR